MSFLHKIRRIWMIYAHLTQNYAVKIYALFLQLESANFSLLECRIFMDWCWFMFCDNNWCSLILIDADWCLLILIYADWWFLMLMLIDALDAADFDGDTVNHSISQWLLALIPGVTHLRATTVPRSVICCSMYCVPCRELHWSRFSDLKHLLWPCSMVG